MAVRREIVQTPSETGAWSHEGPRRTLLEYVEGLKGEPAWCSGVSAIGAEAAMENPG